MKILYIHTYYKHRGGEDSVFENDIQLLKEAGNEVDLISFDNDKNSFLKFIQSPFNVFSYIKVRRKIKTFQPELVHIHNFHFAASPSVIRAVKNKNIPCVVTLHNFRLVCPSGTLYFKGKLFMQSLHKSFPWKAVEKGVFRNSKLLTFWLAFGYWVNSKMHTWEKVDLFIVLNQYAKDLIQSHYNYLPAEKFSIKPNFISFQQNVESKRNNTFLYVGRLSDEKGIEVLLQAHHAFEFELLIIGDGPLRSRVESHVSTHKNITYLGTQKRQTVAAYMSACAALVLPSVCMEMNPLTMIEAMSCKMPVIASDLHTLEGFIINGYNGWRFTLSNPVELNTCIQRFLALSNEEKLNYGNNAKKTYEKYFTKECNMQQLIGLYRSLIKKNKAGLGT